MHRLWEIREDGMFWPVLGPCLKHKIRVVENTVMTVDAEGREGGRFDHNVIMISVQCGIWKTPLS